MPEGKVFLLVEYSAVAATFPYSAVQSKRVVGMLSRIQNFALYAMSYLVLIEGP